MSEYIKKTSLCQYLTFRLGEEMFALDVSRVREILDVTAITKVPRSPDFMRGIINVRGSVVPVIDLRMKFDMLATERTVDTRIIVMEIAVNDQLMVVGTLADAVNNVTDLESGQIEDAPKIGAKWNANLIKGIGKHKGEFIIIIDVDLIFSAEELAMVHKNKLELSEDQEIA